MTDTHRRDQLRIGTDEDIVLDDRLVLVGAVVIAGDRPGTDIDPAANGGIANISQMIGFRVCCQAALLDLDEIADMHIFGQFSSWSQAGKGADAPVGTDVHLGNFVEVKNSNISDHSKANHLAYVGDADIGKRVNVGAGTITCNYDGANKFRTIIEDDVFIGSDTQLVAPVRVGRGATLGAGTTLSKDAPAEQLTVSRAKQVSVEGWKRPVKAKKA